MKQHTRGLGLYFIASGTAAAVNFGSRFVYDSFFTFGTSVVLAYCTGMFVNFSLSKLFVFDARTSGRTWREFTKFIAVASLGLVVTYGVSMGGVWFFERWSFGISVELYHTLAHVAGMGAGFVANFIGHKLISFRETGLWDAFRKREK